VFPTRKTQSVTSCAQGEGLALSDAITGRGYHGMVVYKRPQGPKLLASLLLARTRPRALYMAVYGSMLASGELPSSFLATYYVLSNTTTGPSSPSPSPSPPVGIYGGGQKQKKKRRKKRPAAAREDGSLIECLSTIRPHADHFLPQCFVERLMRDLNLGPTSKHVLGGMLAVLAGRNRGSILLSRSNVRLARLLAASSGWGRLRCQVSSSPPFIISGKG